ncbi:hypothetical protein IE81DRAFT_240762 [Ceraceosorus guamensis]|uniref:Peptidase S9 prolyl oligopeptidase catalytic domain-containing protein n=1 Tax=Ceraceosorus guamensis TaxID=1522189 RepID=A0A316W556_9BASI|nr:hypothetical protein IE81DRAFT_240762 [Ceraceosorus guamensis]PWN44852.1 hypothetical protein IE81DRAFT_240762 [Ceraceosorus guamensis]
MVMLDGLRTPFLVVTAAVTGWWALSTQARQQVLLLTESADKVALSLGTEWQSLGPFPAGMREQAFGALFCTAFASIQDLVKDPSASLPSTYGYLNGSVPLQRFTAEPEINSKVKGGRPIRHKLALHDANVDWTGPRTTAGWSSQQWESLVWTDLNLTAQEGVSDVLLVINVDKGAEFALLPADSGSAVPLRWHNGDLYSYNEAPTPLRPMSAKEAASVPLPHLIRVAAGCYKLLVRALYEIRLFGDPDHSEPTGVPNMEVGIHIEVLSSRPDSKAASAVVVQGALLRQADIVGGQFAGHGLGLGIRNEGSQPVIVEAVRGLGPLAKFLVPALPRRDLAIEALQTRPVFVHIEQLAPVPMTFTSSGVVELEIEVVLRSSNPSMTTQKLSVCFALRSRPSPFSSGGRRLSARDASYTFTYPTADGALEHAIAIPPQSPPIYARDQSKSVVLGLHGAGVEATDPAWASSFIRHPTSWIVLPTGRASWGYDWQLSSSSAATLALHTLSHRLYGLPPELEYRQLWHFDPSSIYVLGHSNGGQGANQYISHFPDKVIGGAVLAGYIKVRDYVSFDWGTSHHVADPALIGILSTSLSTFENDLHASNMVATPLLYKYGKEDDNVPTWHSRTMAALIQSWNARSSKSSAVQSFVSVSEVPARGHWWDTIIQEKDVQLHLNRTLEIKEAKLQSFTLSSANPAEVGSMQGFRIIELEVPGRLARLSVEFVPSEETGPEQKISVKTFGVQAFSIAVNKTAWRNSSFQASLSVSVNNQAVRLSSQADGQTLLFERGQDGSFACASAPEDVGGLAGLGYVRPIGPAIRILSTPAPLLLVLPTRTSQDSRQHYKSAALRIAHDALLYGHIDSEIVSDVAALEMVATTNDGANATLGNIVILGGPMENLLAEHMLNQNPSPITFLNSGQLRVRDRTFADPSTGLLMLQPHPVTHQRSENLALLLYGNDASGIERAAKLFPVRTGLSVPEWIVIGPEADWSGIGAILGAGWFDRRWQWSESMSWLA